MIRAKDVAAYILQEKGEMTAMKLQKLVYYCQAWSLVWDAQELFPEVIEAWANGPVIPSLYKEHRGKFLVVSGDIKGNPEALRGEQKATVDAVLIGHGERSSWYLSELTHREAPWRKAREGLRPGERGTQEISHADMAEYYGSL